MTRSSLAVWRAVTRWDTPRAQAARLLVPRLRPVPNSSYTFVTGGAGEEARSALGQINAQAVWGLAAAMRTDARHYPSASGATKISEVRVGLRFNRRVEERYRL